MKSAYELAMEKVQKDNPGAGKKMTEKQKKRLADADSFYRAKVAEKEILHKPKIVEARRIGDATGVAELERQLTEELRKLAEECESEKEKIRKNK